MPRQARQPDPVFTNRTLVLDNGEHTIKAGFANEEPDPQRDCYIIPNCIARSNEGGGRSHKTYIADQLEECKDTGEMIFRRPVEKGYIVNWDAELDIWKQGLFNKGAKVYCEPSETNLVLTEAPNCPQSLQYNADQIIFEELEFASAYRCLGASLNAYNDIATLTGDEPLQAPPPAECFLLVDSGYSRTTVIPVLYGRPVQSAIKRLDVGGKTLTNLLKELASLRHWNLMDDSYLVSQIKEDTCYVSKDFNADLEAVWNFKNTRSKSKTMGKIPGKDIIQEYVLPDYRTTFRGHVHSNDDSKDDVNDQTNLPLGNERFVVPEILFNPSDLGMSQAGLPEMIVQSLSQLPPGIWPGMLANVVLTGGNVNIPGFRDRLEKELRALTPADCLLRVRMPEDPITYTWLGGARMAANRDMLKAIVVTRQEYMENGSAWTARQFASAPRT